MSPSKKRLRGRPKGTTRANGYKVGSGRPKTVAPSTLAPSTLAPSTLAPSTLAPSTVAPTLPKKASTRLQKELPNPQSSAEDPETEDPPSVAATPSVSPTNSKKNSVSLAVPKEVTVTVPELNIELPTAKINNETTGVEAPPSVGGGIKRKRTPEAEVGVEKKSLETTTPFDVFEADGCAVEPQQ
ncbi:hypothetical protein BV898_10572 [Hypsibius exemplaris]|uniref:Uncharacterized protein n=1 Tax=Hypsibius exemplaris TaxID=2072580 RepID=A0A1W0WIZ2_HYPEX|nr:hypothetical protein BV898_10572 [Hypsibius exemplaris]